MCNLQAGGRGVIQAITGKTERVISNPSLKKCIQIYFNYYPDDFPLGKAQNASVDLRFFISSLMYNK